MSQQEKVEPEFDIWNTTPHIEGFSREEVEQIYQGNFDAVLERFQRMLPEERDNAIIGVLPKLGRVSHNLASQLDIAIDEWKDQKHARECTTSLKYLDEFENKLLSYFRGA